MISIIICSINKNFAQQVQENIAATIGVEWEAIVIDNTISPKSITAVYNEAAPKAKYEVLCFVHEDVLFKTENWGQKIVGYFTKDNNLGLIGIGGSKYKSKTPSGWFTGIPAFDSCNITHYDSNGKELKIYFNPVPGSNLQEAIVLDGVFLCCPAQVWREKRFDDVLLKDFHLYDLDFSFRVAETYKVQVSFEIDMVHIVKGAHYGNKWLEATLEWHEAMQLRLPVALRSLEIDKEAIEKKILRNWIIRLKHEKISMPNRLRWLKTIQIWKHISAWPYVVLFLLKKIFKK